MILAAARGGQHLARFRSETEIIAQLQHPNIVPIYEVGEHEDRPYYSMEYLDGGSLAQRLAVAPLVPRTAAELALVLARAIHFAHERGIVHRDLKPANVLMAADGAPKIVDFGLAKQLGGDREGAPFHTESGAILGTPAYMAPEQVESKNKIGPVVDVYALGAILYECLTGRPPFRAATVLETLEQVRQQEPPPISRLRRDAAATRRRAADIQQFLGQYDSAAENYRRAIELMESLPAEDRNSPELQSLQATSYLNWGSMAATVRRTDEAMRYNGKALEIFERLFRDWPGTMPAPPPRPMN